MKSKALNKLVDLFFARRSLIIVLFAVATCVMLWSASQLKIDAGFDKMIPLKHEYMQNFSKHKKEFGGANSVLIALSVNKGDIYTPEFMEALQKVTDEVFFLPGVDRSRVSSLFTPDARYNEVTEQGFEGGAIIPADFQPVPESIKQVSDNVLKSTYIGRLVANDFTGAMIKTEILDADPTTGEKFDFVEIGHKLEDIRARYQTDNINLHIIGFAKVVTDMTDGAGRVLIFFAISVLITLCMVWYFTRSFRISVLAITCTVAAVVWQLGLMSFFGYGLDPMALLVPFLIFAIGTSHAVQVVTAVGAEIHDGATVFDACKNGVRRLLAPGIIALASDLLGFLTIVIIQIRVIQDMAVSASLGVIAIILLNLILLPVLLSYVKVSQKYRDTLHRRAEKSHVRWLSVSQFCEKKRSLLIIAIAVVLYIFGSYYGAGVRIGDMLPGVPELRPESVYNQDSNLIAEKFTVGVDVLSVFAETSPDGCIENDVLTDIDGMAWHLANVSGVQAAVSLPEATKIATSGWSEGDPHWRIIPRSSFTNSQSISFLPRSAGLFNSDCSVIPIYLFTMDHRAETIERIVKAAKEYRDANPSDKVRFTLAGNNVGVMAATNEEVKASQYPILIYIYAAVVLLCLMTFRTLRGSLTILLPLTLVSVLGYALMAFMEIGLKVNTLPVISLGVGVGVDYGIYIYSRLATYLEEGYPLRRAFEMTLDTTGNGVILTGLTLGVGVGTWVFSPLKFQADMGIVLTFLFVANMILAIILLPALCRWLLPKSLREGSEDKRRELK